MSDPELTHIASLCDLASAFMYDDTLLRLRLLALVGDGFPELAEIAKLLDRVELLLGVHIARLSGASVSVHAGEYLVVPLPGQ